ncbi:MAG: ABC transporter substrate-binding protein [Candidatus Endonucleobacter bathymodioli]|uniref:ABC transporter substrate-binding protein n=1 Tax=Candidatus Endonucleibacter bathymodioli TaxID=539814 RepID=A0AA90SYT3_9GAMM|nr:ABC transporter substrate-binding protein [Candidatus Endonucleobacter bathymodioli]
MYKKTLVVIVTTLMLQSCSGPWNNPHLPEIGDEVIYQTNFQLPPKNLDPAISFSSDEALFLSQIYEPPLGYHFLKRPYELEPLVASALPDVRYLDDSFTEINKSDPAVAYSRYIIHLKKGILYQPHPAFVTENNHHSYFFDTTEQGKDYQVLTDFESTDTRELIADDFIYQIKRLADPTNSSPIFSLMGQHIIGMNELSKTLNNSKHKGWLDLRYFSMPGLEKLNDYTYAITIKGIYPQFYYWLAMSFFAPMPWEADRFFKNPGFKEKNLTLDWYPIGTGPFMMIKNDPNHQIILVRNPNYRDDYYPDTGAPGDTEKGYLVDAGKKIPFIDKAVYTLDKSSLPMWTKFLQGYYDRSGENHGNVTQQFDQALAIGPNGIELSKDMQNKNISLSEDIKPAIYYYGFNMLDPVVGGYSHKQKQLRQAIAIAWNIEDYIDIFQNGSALPYMNPIAPGIAGHLEGEASINPYTHNWIADKAVRKDIEYARQLMTEAGYPSGRDINSGKPLKLYFDVQSQATNKNIQDWQIRQLKQLGIQLEFRTSDWNRYKEKMRDGNFQLFMHGWLADYPDPENFLFLFDGSQESALCQCNDNNVANYDNPKYNRLFSVMKTMDPGSERKDIITQMVDLIRQDAPWFTGYYSKDYYLNNEWVYNGKRHGISKATLKYLRIDSKLRTKKQLEWNKPHIASLIVCFSGFILLVIPAIRTYRRRQTLTVSVNKE